jgi:hypothetical protein
MNNELRYLAAPYTHSEHYMLVARFMLINRAAAKLMERGLYVFSPISHTHPIAESSSGKLPRGWQYWETFDRLILGACKRLIVLRLPGWETSTGVKNEIKIAEELNLFIEYTDYEYTPTYDEVVAEAKALENAPNDVSKEILISIGETSVSTFDISGNCVNTANDRTTSRTCVLHGLSV